EPSATTKETEETKEGINSAFRRGPVHHEGANPTKGHEDEQSPGISFATASLSHRETRSESARRGAAQRRRAPLWLGDSVAQHLAGGELFRGISPRSQRSLR